MCSWHKQLAHVIGVGASAVGDGRLPRGSIMHATQVDVQNGISIGSADFAALTIATHKTDRQTMGHQDHRRNFRREEVRGVRVTPHFLKWGYCIPTFKRYKSPSFELKMRNAWVAGALPQLD